MPRRRPTPGGSAALAAAIKHHILLQKQRKERRPRVLSDGDLGTRSLSTVMAVSLRGLRTRTRRMGLEAFLDSRRAFYPVRGGDGDMTKLRACICQIFRRRWSTSTRYTRSLRAVNEVEIVRLDHLSLHLEQGRTSLDKDLAYSRTCLTRLSCSCLDSPKDSRCYVVRECSHVSEGPHNASSGAGFSELCFAVGQTNFRGPKTKTNIRRPLPHSVLRLSRPAHGAPACSVSTGGTRSEGG